MRLDEADLAGLGGHDGDVLLRVVHGILSKIEDTEDAEGGKAKTVS
jgi:hypothetical protein